MTNKRNKSKTKLYILLILLTFFTYPALSEDVKIYSKGIDLDEPIKNTQNNEVKKLIKDILEDIEDSIEGHSNSRYKAIRIVEGTVNNFNVKNASLNLKRAFGYYSQEYRGLFLDLMTSKLMTHGIETGAAAVATIVQIAAPELTGWQRTGLGFVQSLAIPGAVDFLCWAGDACFISFYSYRKAMRKIRLNLVKVPKKMGITKVWNKLFQKVDGELLIDNIIKNNSSVQAFTTKIKNENQITFKLHDKRMKKAYAELNFNKSNKGLNLKSIRFYNETVAQIPKKEFSSFVSLFNKNIEEAVTTGHKLLSQNAIDELNKKFHIEEVIDEDFKTATQTRKTKLIKIKNNTVTFSGKWKLKKKSSFNCEHFFLPFVKR